jgi:ATP-dependent RNA helicase HelY
MRSKIEGRDLDLYPRRRPAGGGGSAAGADDTDEERSRRSASPDHDFSHDADEHRGSDLAATGPGSDGDLSGDEPDTAELRRKLRHHPCHACPDREQHARQSERYFRQKKEVDDLERQIGSRSHVIARTFDRVCAVLDELGYLDGDTVTPAGQRLSRLYSELDLLAAECLRRGVWEGLNPAELAACVSVMSFESRKQPDDVGPARLPKGPVSDVLTAMARTWGELDDLEKRNGLSFLREPDPGFVWAAYRWVRGAKLEDVLDSVPGLTPGDFVRSVKQLIDLLDQIAGAASRDKPTRDKPTRDTATRDAAGGQETVTPRDRDVAATARAAIDAMRRGVIAYTTLAD